MARKPHRHLGHAAGGRPMVLKQTTVFNIRFHHRAIFQNVVLKFYDSARSLVRKIFPILKRWCFCVLRTLPLSRALSLSATSGQLESTSTFTLMAQQQSVPLVEKWNVLTTIRTIGRRAESVVGCKQVLFVLMDAAVSACTFPRPSIAVKGGQLYSEMKKCQSVFL